MGEQLPAEISERAALAGRGIAPGNLAVITGGADGIGLACAARLLALEMSVVLVDIDSRKLARARADLANIGDAARIHEAVCDVSDAGSMCELEQRLHTQQGPVSFLMNNAATAKNPGASWENRQEWEELISVNWRGVLNGVQAFAPVMIASGQPGAIVNTGSKQGITRPPGNSAYNVSKAALLAYTEMLAHELRNVPDCQVSAHLLIPGFTYTGIVRERVAEKPAAAWTPEQVADFMLAALARNDFYILCPDNETDRHLDEKRIAWTADDIIRNRPPLSRWHPDYISHFQNFIADSD